MFDASQAYLEMNFWILSSEIEFCSFLLSLAGQDPREQREGSWILFFPEHLLLSSSQLLQLCASPVKSLGLPRCNCTEEPEFQNWSYKAGCRREKVCYFTPQVQVELAWLMARNTCFEEVFSCGKI